VASQLEGVAPVSYSPLILRVASDIAPENRLKRVDAQNDYFQFQIFKSQKRSKPKYSVRVMMIRGQKSLHSSMPATGGMVTLEVYVTIKLFAPDGTLLHEFLVSDKGLVGIRLTSDQELAREIRAILQSCYDDLLDRQGDDGERS
jgi:hypothetical protein